MSIWDDAPKGTKEAWAVLSECAKYMHTIAYEDLGERIHCGNRSNVNTRIGAT